MPSEFRHQRRVEFADTDTAGLIHFTAVLKFMEETEHAFYRSLGFSGYTWTEESVFGIPRVAVSCDYLGAVRYGDLLDIRLLVRDVRTKAIRYEAEFTVDRDGETQVVARGEMTVVCAAREHGTMAWGGVEIPEALRSQLEVAEAG